MKRALVHVAALVVVFGAGVVVGMVAGIAESEKYVRQTEREYRAAYQQLGQTTAGVDLRNGDGH